MFYLESNMTFSFKVQTKKIQSYYLIEISINERNSIGY